MKNKIKIILSFILLFKFGHTQSPENELGNWLMYFGTHQLNDKYSIHYETQLRNYELFTNFNQLLPRIGINYKIDEHSMVTAGYAFIPTQTEIYEGWNDELVTENRVWQQFILRNKVGNISIRHRYRLEQRWIKKLDVVEGSNTISVDEYSTTYKNRARYMLSLKIPLSNNNDFPLFISIYDEIFLDLSQTPFDQNRLFGALGFQINNNMNIQAGYLRHRAGSLDLNRLQLALFLKTGNKPKKKE